MSAGEMAERISKLPAWIPSVALSLAVTIGGIAYNYIAGNVARASTIEQLRKDVDTNKAQLIGKDRYNSDQAHVTDSLKRIETKLDTLLLKGHK
jgi:hypothetical protein